MPRGGKRANAGRKRLTPEVLDAKKLAQAYTADAMKTLHSIMKDDECDPRARVQAANSILDRGHGKPTQAVKLDADVKYRTASDGEVSADSILAGLAKCLGAAAAVAVAGSQGAAGSVPD